MLYIYPIPGEPPWDEAAACQREVVLDAIERSRGVLPRFAVFSFSQIALCIHLCPFGSMASAQFFSGPTPYCRRDTLQRRKLFIFGRVKRIGSLFGGFANGIQLAKSSSKSYRMTYYLVAALGRLKT
jgi:hypothetical protein